jgi:hypothetical protein
MTASLKVSNVLEQAKQLSKDDQLTLLQQLASLLKRGDVENNNTTSLTALSGLGSHIWQSAVRIDEYIEMERQW